MPWGTVGLFRVAFAWDEVGLVELGVVVVVARERRRTREAAISWAVFGGELRGLCGVFEG